MASNKNLRSIFSDIANAIRRKKGNTNKIIPINFSDEIDSIELGVFPQGKINLTDTSEYDVTQFATAQIVDEKLKPENIKIGENILGVEGNVTTLKGYLDIKKNTDSMFANFSSLTYDQLEKIIAYDDTSNVTNMGNMFKKCSNLSTIPLLDTSNVTDMNNMFNSCSNLSTIPLLDTSNVTNMSYMFRGCILLNKIDITHMNTSNIEKTSDFAYDCFSLTKLIIRNMSSVPLLKSNAFTNCYHFTGTKNNTYNPDGLKDGRIYVPDDMVDTLKSATNWSKYADIIVPLSTLEE